jgi:hypothetical protein
VYDTVDHPFSKCRARHAHELARIPDVSGAYNSNLRRGERIVEAEVQACSFATRFKTRWKISRARLDRLSLLSYFLERDKPPTKLCKLAPLSTLVNLITRAAASAPAVRAVYLFALPLQVRAIEQPASLAWNTRTAHSHGF